MANFIKTLLILFIFGSCIAFGIWLAITVCKADIPLWLKLYLLK